MWQLGVDRPFDGNQHILIQLLVHLVSFLEHVATIRTFAFEEVVSTCVQCLGASFTTQQCLFCSVYGSAHCGLIKLNV